MISKFLRQFLAHNEQAYIPRLGTFFAEDKKAESDPSKKEMKPPVRTVSFKQQSSKDHSFLEFLARVDGKSEEAIKKELTKWVENLKKEIVAKKKVELEGLGHLGINSAKKVVFKPLPNLNISPDTLGMQPVDADVVEAIKEEVKSSEKLDSDKKPEKKEEKKEEKREDKAMAAAAAAPVAGAAAAAAGAKIEAESKREEPKESPKTAEKKEAASAAPKKEEKKGSNVGIIVIVIILILAVAGLSYYFLNKGEEKKPVVVEKPEPQPEPKPEPEPEPEPKPEPKPVVTISERNGRFYVVGNSFEIESNAYAYRDKVISEGKTDSKIILPDDKSRLYRVSLAEFDNLDAAVSKMEELRSEYGNTIWVLIY